MPPVSGPQSADILDVRPRRVPDGIRDVPLAFVAVLWLGLLAGASFLATPVKFQAPSLDLPTALDVGRVTFALLSKVEWLLCALLVLAALLAPRPGRWRWAGIAVLVSILLVQALWLLPVLDGRVGRIIAGAAVPASSHHLLYVLAEAVKALLLLALSLATLWRLSTVREAAPCA